ncbi:MAG TPA: hypothetical protein VH933_01050 [Aestuariivirgaceae bacterium]|jgi:hypothetical protein
MMTQQQTTAAEHISSAIRCLFEAAELTEGTLTELGRKHFTSILLQVGAHMEQARIKI